MISGVLRRGLRPTTPPRASLAQFILPGMEAFLCAQLPLVVFYFIIGNNGGESDISLQLESYCLNCAWIMSSTVYDYFDANVE